MRAGKRAQRPFLIGNPPAVTQMAEHRLHRPKQPRLPGIHAKIDLTLAMTSSTSRSLRFAEIGMLTVERPTRMAWG